MRLRAAAHVAVRDVAKCREMSPGKKILGLSRSSAYRYVAAGELPIKRFGGRVYVITARIRPLLDGTEELAA